MSTRVLCAWLPNWPYQRMLQHEPKLANQPFVLQARDPRRGRIVAATSPLARELGAQPGMSLSEVQSLSSQILVEEHDAHQDIEDLCRLAEAAQRFSPIVGIEAPEKHLWGGRTLIQPQALLLDVTGLAPIFGDESQLASQLQAWFQQQGYLSCIAIANSLGAAWALANYHARHLLLERLAQQHRQTAWEPIPICLTHDTPSTRHHLQRLPVEALRLDHLTLQSLKRLGLFRIEQLAQLPRQGLASRFSPTLLQRLNQTWDEQPEPLIAWQSPPEYDQSFAFEHPTQHRETIETVLKRLVAELSQRLQQRGEGALRLLARLHMPRHPAIVLQLNLFRPTAEAEHLQRLLVGQCDRQWERGCEITHVRLQATLIGKLTWQQPALFELDQVRYRDQAAMLIDGLSSRLGRTRVVAPQLHRDPQPELAFQWRPLTGLRNDGQSQETHRKLRPWRDAGPQVSDPHRRPLRLLPSPLRLTILQLNEQHLPTELLYQGCKQKVEHLQGPERIESGWWRGPSQRRDYYQLVTDRGHRLWIFRSLTQPEWYLHGSFD